MLFGENNMEIDCDKKEFPEDMSQDGVLSILVFKNLSASHSYHRIVVKVKPAKDSMSGVVEFCNSGTQYRDRKIHALLKRIKDLLLEEVVEHEHKRLKIRVGEDGDIRVFITEKPEDRMSLDPEKVQEIEFFNKEKNSPIFNLLRAYFDYPEMDPLSYKFI